MNQEGFGESISRPEPGREEKRMRLDRLKQLLQDFPEAHKRVRTFWETELAGLEKEFETNEDKKERPPRAT